MKPLAGSRRRQRFDLRDVLHGRSLIIASNRGPVSFSENESGNLVPSRGAGGLVTALTEVMKHASGTWVASALSAGDRRMINQTGDEHFQVPGEGDDLRLRYLAFDRVTFDRYYNKISNAIFWFLMHSMWNLPFQPRFSRITHDSWIGYQTVNQRFAEALAEEISGSEGTSPVMIHDYHLMLVARYLRKLVPEAFSYHFMHCPWPQPDLMRVLPGSMAEETLEGMLANDLLGFQTRRWSRNFMWCCQEILGAEVDMDKGLVQHLGKETVVRDYPISIDTDSVKKLAYSRRAQPHLNWLERTIGGRKLILRVDRLELSKNVVRGFLALQEMLHAHPELQGQVVHLALLYPSRRAISEYHAYEAEVLDMHDRINEEFGTEDWQPIVIVNEDNYVRALACGRKYDVMMVNPIADGMNLVAKEGPVVNENDGVLILSKNAGAWYELGHAALSINPYDIHEMAEALYRGLTMEKSEKAELAAILKEVIDRNTPSKWVWYQLSDIRRLHEGAVTGNDAGEHVRFGA
ncbi:MAG: alpha,alpha-trehalose-phosphate synthase (UDP-forming) [Actinomycetota bacterium]